MESTSFEFQNTGCSFQLGSKMYINCKDWKGIISSMEQKLDMLMPKDIKEQARYLLKAIQLIDLTTLNGNDTKQTVERLCQKAFETTPDTLISALSGDLGVSSKEPVNVASVCVYPARVDDCRLVLRPNHSNIGIASTAGGFPAGQTTTPVKKLEIREAILCGANEIDVVINRSFALDGQWEKVYAEVKEMKGVCSEVALLKTILATGELESLDNVYKASAAAMLAGSDFIKTSTGKETVNATIPVGIVMMSAIKDYYELTGYKVGFKPAGGIKTAQDALTWLTLVKCILGDEWLTPRLFRIGASSLLDNIVNELYKITGAKKNTTDGQPKESSNQY